VKLQTKILIGLLGGIVVGAAARLDSAGWLKTSLSMLEPLGTIFIRLVTMVVIPMVVASLFVGIASLGNVRAIGRIGGRTLLYFLGTTILAATIGLTIAMGTGVGSRIDAASRDALLDQTASATVDTSVKLPGLAQTLVDLVPQNLFAAAVRGDLLPLIVAVCLFAAAATTLPTDRRAVLSSFFEAVNDATMLIVRWLMVLAPPAVFILVALTVSTSGLDLLVSLAGYAGVAVLAMLVHLAVVLTPALVLGAHRRFMDFVKGASDPLMMAFSTASSNVTLPVSMRAARERLDIPGDVVSFVLPAGATLNKNGAAVYKAVTAVFLARLYGVDLGVGKLIGIVATSTVAAFAGAGVPGSSLVTTLVVLNAIGLGAHAAAGIALVTGIDRPLDMCRSALNTFGNLVGAAWIGRTRGHPERSDGESPAFASLRPTEQ
jgi:Na+/H+-dicarboxylate symporter